MKFLVLFLSLFPVGFLQAQQAGIPDSSFHVDGKLNTPIPPQRNGTAKGLALLPDGRIIAGGYSNNGNNTDFTLVCYKADGTLDSSFNTTGILQIDFNGAEDVGNSVALSASGEEIIIGGYTSNGSNFDFALAQYKLDGNPDANFGTGGKLTTSFGATSFGNALVVQDDGKIILAGYSFQTTNEFALARYNTDGTPDSTFGVNGKVLTQPAPGASIGRCIAIQPDGKIVVAGETANDSTLRWEIAVARYNPDGSPDSTFHGDGVLASANGNVDVFAYGAGFQSDGKIVLGGYSGTSPSNNRFLLVRYHPDGRIDSTFGTNGFLNTAFSPQNNQAFSLLMQPDDKILLGGSAMINGLNNFAVARFNADGSLDSTFGVGGKATTSIGSNDGIYVIVPDAEWNLVAAGTAFHGAGFDFAAARYLNDFEPPHTGVPHHDVFGATVYPNPVRDAATLRFTLQKQEALTIELIDMNGSIVNSFVINQTTGAGTHTQSLTLPKALPSGVYHILISSASGRAALQVVKR